MNHPPRDDEQLFAGALQRDTVTIPDLSDVERRARRDGSRLRHRRQGAVGLAAVVVAGLGVGAVALGHGGGDRPGTTVSPAVGFAATATAPSSAPAPSAPTPSPTDSICGLNRIEGRRHLDVHVVCRGGRVHAPRSTSPLDLSDAYAVLDDDGWTAPDDNVIADDKLYYTEDDGPGTLSLNWRPDDLGPRYSLAQLEARYGGGHQVGTTTIDGDDAGIFESSGSYTVVGPVRQGRFLTLSVTSTSLAEVKALAPEVHRQ